MGEVNLSEMMVESIMDITWMIISMDTANLNGKMVKNIREIECLASSMVKEHIYR